MRWIDTFSELAYLLMDLESCNSPGFANRVLNQYLDYSGDYSGLKLLRLYKFYRAMVRAKVDVLQSKQAQQTTAGLSERYYHYIQLAGSYIVDQTPFIAITYGVAASGKSTVSEFIAAHFNAVRLRSDIERKRLFGLKPLERSSSELKSLMY